MIILFEVPYLLPAPVPGHPNGETLLTGTQYSMCFVLIQSIYVSSLLLRVPWFLSVLKQCGPKYEVSSVIITNEVITNYTTADLLLN